jgi:hypothetical protein
VLCELLSFSIVGASVIVVEERSSCWRSRVDGGSAAALLRMRTARKVEPGLATRLCAVWPPPKSSTSVPQALLLLARLATTHMCVYAAPELSTKLSAASLAALSGEYVKNSLSSDS